jgi:OOP family OmpA-OmpF porin
MKKIAIISSILLTAGVAMNAQAHSTNEGYITDSKDQIVRTGFGGCWRHGFWEADDAVEGCAGYVAPAPAPEPAPAPAPVFKDLEMKESKVVYFDFDSAAVSSVSDITGYLSTLTTLESIKLTGYTDVMGSQEYNMALSKKRVEAVEAALIEAGVDASLISSDYFGESNPVKVCEPATKACLAENRRVTVDIEGVKRVQQ